MAWESHICFHAATLGSLQVDYNWEYPGYRRLVQREGRSAEITWHAMTSELVTIQTPEVGDVTSQQFTSDHLVDVNSRSRTDSRPKKHSP